METFFSILAGLFFLFIGLKVLFFILEIVNLFYKAIKESGQERTYRNTTRAYKSGKNVPYDVYHKKVAKDLVYFDTHEGKWYINQYDEYFNNHKFMFALPTQTHYALVSLLIKNLLEAGVPYYQVQSIAARIRASYKVELIDNLSQIQDELARFVVYDFLELTLNEAEKFFGINNENFYNFNFQVDRTNFTLVQGSTLYKTDFSVTRNYDNYEYIAILGDISREQLYNSCVLILRSLFRDQLSPSEEELYLSALRGFEGDLNRIYQNVLSFHKKLPPDSGYTRLCGNISFFKKALDLLATISTKQEHYRQQAAQESEQIREAYQFLGLTKGSTYQEAQEAHRKMIRQWHPDRAPKGQEAQYAAKSVKINQAWELIKSELS